MYFSYTSICYKLSSSSSTSAIVFKMRNDTWKPSNWLRLKARIRH